MQLKNTVIIICGPTAIGKTKLAIEIALHLQTKIISADSRQCFKELNIGVAKPSLYELNLVEHFFINSNSIKEDTNAVSFETYALKKVNAIFQSTNYAVMVGGTGLYIKAFCEGLDEIPAIPTELRNDIYSNYKANGLTWLQKQLQAKDKNFWEIAEQQNPQRLMRALEVVEFTGKSINEFRKRKQQTRDFNIIKIGLETEREKLYSNINNRVDEMIQMGLVEEVKNLLPFANYNALQTVGYKEIFDYLNGNCSLDFAIESIKQHTRNYAKRQITWFKKDKDIKWFNQNEYNEIIAYINAVKP